MHLIGFATMLLASGEEFLAKVSRAESIVSSLIFSSVKHRVRDSRHLHDGTRGRDFVSAGA